MDVHPAWPPRAASNSRALATVGLTVSAQAAPSTDLARTAASTEVTSQTVVLSGGLKLVPAAAGYNYIVNLHSAKCLTVDGNSSSKGASEVNFIRSALSCRSRTRDLVAQEERLRVLVAVARR